MRGLGSPAKAPSGVDQAGSNYYPPHSSGNVGLRFGGGYQTNSEAAKVQINYNPMEYSGFQNSSPGEGYFLIKKVGVHSRTCKPRKRFCLRQFPINQFKESK